MTAGDTSPRPRVIASIEARMSSSRLPGKMLMDVNGRPVVGRVVERLRRCRTLDGIVLATTTNPADDALAAWAAANDVACFRGSEDDVLQRVVDAQASLDSAIVVEVCGDTPLLDPDVIDMAVETFFANDVDVVSNTARLSFPQGIDAQVFPLERLRAVAETVDDPAVREHVSLHFYENPDRYRLLHLQAPPRWCRPEQRLQLDYPEDLALIRAVYERLETTPGHPFGLEEILALLAAEPALAALNADCEERAAR